MEKFMSNQVQVLPLGQFLASKEAHIAQALPGTSQITAKRVMRLIMSEASKSPKLRECTQQSLLSSVLECCRLGVEPGSALGHAYLIPYNNRTKGVMECQFILGYRGMIEIARRSGQIVSLYSHAVYENDAFEIELGLHANIKHSPARGARGAFVGAYAVAHLKDGGYQMDWMSKDDIDKIRARSKSGDKGPWVTDYQEMGKKSVVRRLFKMLPVSTEVQRLVQADEAADRGEQSDFVTVEGEIVDIETGEIEQPKSQADALADKI